MSHSNARVEGIRVGPAKHGRGVFATRAFDANETIGRVQGRLIEDAEYGSDYCVGLSEELSLEPCAPFRFLNHSCEPNCVLYQYDVMSRSGQFLRYELWVETLRPVQSGEQLTIDYSWPAEEAIPCGCDSPACRGWIVAMEDLPRLMTNDKHGETARSAPLSRLRERGWG